MVKVSIIGATGYAGAELLRLLYNHPQVEVVHITSESYTGKAISEVYPHLRGLYDQKLISMKDLDIIAKDSDFVFIGLPHGHAGVQGTVGVLKHDLHILAHGPQLPLVLGHQIHAVELDIAPGGLQKPEDRAGQGGLAAAGLPHQAQGLPLVDMEAHVIHCLDIPFGREGPALDGEPLAHVVRPEQDSALFRLRRHLDTSSYRKQRTERPPPMS